MSPESVPQPRACPLTLHAQAYCVKGSPACTQIYTVVSGDYCAKIEYNYNLTSTQLYDLNPWLDSACGEQYFSIYLSSLILGAHRGINGRLATWREPLRWADPVNLWRERWRSNVVENTGMTIF